MKDIYDQMAAIQADGTPKILAALDKLIANGMPFATAATAAMTCARCTTPRKCAVWGCVPGTFPSEPKDPRVAREMERLFAACVPQPPCASTSTASTAPPSTLTLEKLEAAIGAIPPEPIGEWMREQGFPPETSMVILPETMRAQLPFWPKYVRFSLDVGEPMLVRDLLPAQAAVGQIWRGMAP